MPHSLKLRSSNLLGLSILLIFILFIFLISGVMLFLSVVHFGEKWSILIGSLSLFFTVISALTIRWILFPGHHACILHFDQTIKKLNLYPQSIFGKQPVEKIPFVQLEKIEFKEELHTDDNYEEYFTYTLNLKAKHKFISTTAATWLLLWSQAKESQRHEVEELAHLISKITEIPCTFSTDKPLPDGFSG
ncbi:hypothetical protein TPSD3_05990 [Thioflexithrix psekupsensis]|uniref:Uncharacterized protein n=2 Tax=Thioflexithrix psekupsensis TaxID=1570016 RepID=A0A251X7X6_9GAMM|nr:hypothetical protein TPSD3_05990 [Thioflexithrix psekupsensis]